MAIRDCCTLITRVQGAANNKLEQCGATVQQPSVWISYDMHAARPLGGCSVGKRGSRSGKCFSLSPPPTTGCTLNSTFVARCARKNNFHQKSLLPTDVFSLFCCFSCCCCFLHLALSFATLSPADLARKWADKPSNALPKTTLASGKLSIY